MNGHAPAGGRPANATIKPPPIASATPISANPTRRSETACANEFHVAWSNAEKSTANTIVNVTAQAPRVAPYAHHIHSPQMHAVAVAGASRAEAQLNAPSPPCSCWPRPTARRARRFIDAAKEDLGVTE